MNRRTLLSMLGGLALSPALHAQSAQDGSLAVVKILLFSCPLCRATDSSDGALQAELESVGGRFVQAPVPQESSSKERIYYAVRDLAPKHLDRIRQSLYKGVQDSGMPMEDDVQVMVWLQTDLPDLTELNWPKIVEYANGPEVRSAVTRAVTLVKLAPATDTPTYVFIRGGKVVEVLDPTRTSGSLSALRNQVLTQIRDLSKKAAK